MCIAPISGRRQYFPNLQLDSYNELSLVRRIELVYKGVIKIIYDFLSANSLNLRRLEVKSDSSKIEKPVFSQFISLAIYGIRNSPVLSKTITRPDRNFFINISQMFAALSPVFNKRDQAYTDSRSIAKSIMILAFSVFIAIPRQFKQFHALNTGMAVLETSLTFKRTFQGLKKCWNISEHKPLKALGYASIHIASLGVSCFRTYEQLYNPFFIDDIEEVYSQSPEEKLKNICDVSFQGARTICLGNYRNVRDSVAAAKASGKEIRYYTDGMVRLFEDLNLADDQILKMTDYFPNRALENLKHGRDPRQIKSFYF